MPTDPKQLAEWLKDVPYELLSSEMARRNSERRKVRAGGRPKLMKPCNSCGVMLGVRERAKHVCPSP